jgi:predicted nucleic acid-binding protein
MRTFLDTNVFLYAAGGDHPQREPCAGLLRKVAEGTLEATVNSEVVQEILYVLVRRGRRADGVALARHVADLFPDLLPVTRQDMIRACDLVRRYPKLPVRDAVHGATMLSNGLKRVISVDRDFDQIAGIDRVDPSSA